ncbi:MAG: hypothetical protein QT00_C0001G0501 [archaeon GW2011_AR5]|nr:MAG: hypothetical protein QT00_C0001G0501 [archaeon GW2011_AR5]
MNPKTALIVIVLGMLALGAWVARRGEKRRGAKVSAQARFQTRNPQTAAMLGPLFPKSSLRIDEGKILFGIYIIAAGTYTLLSVMLPQDTIWLLVFGALTFCGVGISIIGPDKESDFVGLMLATMGAATVLATLAGIFP